MYPSSSYTYRITYHVSLSPLPHLTVTPVLTSSHKYPVSHKHTYPMSLSPITHHVSRIFVHIPCIPLPHLRLLLSLLSSPPVCSNHCHLQQVFHCCPQTSLSGIFVCHAGTNVPQGLFMYIIGLHVSLHSTSEDHYTHTCMLNTYYITHMNITQDQTIHPTIKHITRKEYLCVIAIYCQSYSQHNNQFCREGKSSSASSSMSVLCYLSSSKSRQISLGTVRPALHRHRHHHHRQDSQHHHLHSQDRLRSRPPASPLQYINSRGSPPHQGYWGPNL